MDCFAAIQHHFTQDADKKAIALVEGKLECESLSYSDLHKKILGLQDFFRKRGLVSGDSVLLLGELRPQSLCVILACFSM